MEVDLKNLDIEILADKSGSMTGQDCPGNKSRWQFMQEYVTGIANSVEKYDENGINLVPFAGQFKVHEGVKATALDQLFKEHHCAGGTETALVLQDRLNAYFKRRDAGSTKPLCLLVFTDGEPNDKNAVAQVIIDATKRMNSDGEIAISFIQVGKDGAATQFLQWLDDGLTAKGAKFDIVDTVPVQELENISPEQLLQKAFAD